MTTLQMIRQIRSAWHEVLQGFYTTGTTSGAGTVSTFVASAFSSFADDFLNEKEIIITSGSNNGFRREIADWDSASTTGTLLEQFPYTVGTGVTFEIGESGFWSDQEIINWLNDSAREVVKLLTNEALWDYLKTSTTNGSAVGSQTYGRAEMPTDCEKIPKSVLVDGKFAPILDVDQKTRFDNDPYIGDAVLLDGRPLAGNVRVLYKPYQDATLTWLYAPSPTTISTTAQTNLTARLHQILVDLTIREGWKKAERLDLATKAEERAINQVNMLNSESQGRI